MTTPEVEPKEQTALKERVMQLANQVWKKEGCIDYILWCNQLFLTLRPDCWLSVQNEEQISEI